MRRNFVSVVPASTEQVQAAEKLTLVHFQMNAAIRITTFITVV